MIKCMLNAVARIAGRNPAKIDHVIARTAWAEARGDGSQGMAGVINVIMHRASRPGWWGRTPEEVCLKPQQFSCWNANDPNRTKALAVDESDPMFARAMILEDAALRGTLVDNTGGATHYHAVGVLPRWAASMRRVARIGGHIFYR
jgi:spore germination cell wall hydrolase CwlJ-like protein